MSTATQDTCPSCGNQFSGAMGFCPVCMLRKALAGGIESGESSASEEAVKPTASERVVQRFEHYELVTGEDGKPVELGRGAMGVTYKAFDVDLHCPVTLKVISQKCLGAPPRQNREQLLLRDGVRRGRNARKTHQTLRSAGRKTGAGNCNAGGCWVGRSSRTETCSPGYQTE